MLKHLIRFSVDNAALICVFSALVLLFAAYQAPRMPVDVFPELNAPTVTIMTESPGYAADEVEQYVTFPIESAVNGLPGVRRVRSASAIGLSFVWVEFAWDVDIYRARYLVSERLGIAEQILPPDVHTEITPVTSITGEIMLISLSSPDSSVSKIDLRAYGEFDLRNRLLSVPGVSQVVAIGGELPEYQINVEQDRLRLYDLTIQDVVEAAKKSHTTLGAGYLINVEGLEIPLRQTGRVRSVTDIQKTLVRYYDGTPITIGDVANVSVGGALKRGSAAEGAKPAVVLSIQKAPGANTLLLTEAIDKALDNAEAGLPSGIKLNRHVMRQSDFINLSLKNVLTVARDASIIVAVVLLLFLLNVRTTIITLTAIPMSVAIALLVLWGIGESINVMTLGGLAVAIGVIVDDAIIDVENVHRRLRGNQHKQTGNTDSHASVIVNASNEIRGSIMFATLIIVMVFIPLLFLQGLEGRFFRPLGLMYIASIAASLLVAMTLTPALCRFLLKSKIAKRDVDTFFVRMLKAIYRPILNLVLSWRRVTLTGAIALTALSVWLASTFGTSFLPEFNEGTFTVFVMAPPGTSLVESDRIGQGLEKELAKLDGIRSVVRRTGRAERDEHAEPVSNSEIEVTIESGYSRNEVRHRIDDLLKKSLPGITATIGQPIEHRISRIMSGTPAAIAINVFGDDLDVLRRIAKEIETELKAIPGARDIAANREAMITSLPIRYRSEDLARWGLTPADAAEQVRDAMFGEVVAVVNEGVNVYDIVVRLAPDQRERIDQVHDLILRGIDGKLVRLSEIADIGLESTSNLISRENAQRKAVISCNVAEGHNLGHLVAQVQQKVDPIVSQYGYSVTYGGQFEAQQSASKTIYVMGAGVALLMMLVLNMSLGSTRAAMLVMINLPLALIGGIVAIFLTESGNPIANIVALLGNGHYEAPVISIASMVGFVTLFGIAVRNGILLVNHYSHLTKVENKPLFEAIIQGSQERLVPILMTALTAVLGLVPLAMAGGEPGSELLAPLAIVVLGGLASSTVLNLIIVPAGYALVFCSKKDSDLAK